MGWSGIMKNREVLLKTDLCDLLFLIDMGLSDDYACVLDLLEGIDPKDKNTAHGCPCFGKTDIEKSRRECISNWLNSESKNDHFV